jgi:hypothetical protein
LAEPTVEETDMTLKIFGALALLFTVVLPARAATTIDMQLIRAAFFSDACRQGAEALGIARTSDANALLAAFARLRPRPANPPAASGRDDCGVPAVALINLLRLNGIDAELVSATMAKEAAPADQVERVLVYVPTLARYFDPALPLEEQGLVDLLVRERAERKHVLGPALGADARDACPSTCMHVYTAAGNAPPPVRVKTETIRGR